MQSSSSNQKRYAAGETIIHEGESGDSAFIIVEGSVEVLVGDGDNAKKVATLSNGDVFGEMSLIDPGPRSATVKALTDTACVVASNGEFIDLIKEDPEQARFFLQTMVQRLRQMNEMIASMDPKRRRFLDIIRDWAIAPEAGDENLSAEERQRRLELMHMHMPMF